MPARAKRKLTSWVESSRQPVVPTLRSKFTSSVFESNIKRRPSQRPPNTICGTRSYGRSTSVNTGSIV